MNTFIKNNCKPKSKCKLKCKPKKKPKKKTKPKIKSNSIGRVITYNPKINIPNKPVKSFRSVKPVKPVVKRQVKKPIIKTIQRKDKSIDIILSAK
jgi:hypothetical protein